MKWIIVVFVALSLAGCIGEEEPPDHMCSSFTPIGETPQPSVWCAYDEDCCERDGIVYCCGGGH